MSFKLGDRVEITRGKERGQCGIVVTNDLIWVQTDDGKKVGYEPDTRSLRPLVEPKFKVGDRVRGRVTGRHGTVEGTDLSGALVRFDGRPAAERVINPNLIKIGHEFKLNGGDIIRNTRTDKTGVVYTDGDGVLRIRYLEPTLVSDDVKATAVEEYEHHYPGTYEVLFGVSA